MKIKYRWNASLCVELNIFHIWVEFWICHSFWYKWVKAVPTWSLADSTIHQLNDTKNHHKHTRTTAPVTKTTQTSCLKQRTEPIRNVKIEYLFGHPDYTFYNWIKRNICLIEIWINCQEKRHGITSLRSSFLRFIWLEAFQRSNKDHKSVNCESTMRWNIHKTRQVKCRWIVALSNDFIWSKAQLPQDQANGDFHSKFSACAKWMSGGTFELPFFTLFAIYKFRLCYDKFWAGF